MENDKLKIENKFKRLDRNSPEYRVFVGKPSKNIAFGEKEVEDFEYFSSKLSPEDPKYNLKRNELLEEFFAFKLKKVKSILENSSTDDEIFKSRKFSITHTIERALENREIKETMSSVLGLSKEEVSLGTVVKGFAENKINESLFISILKVHKESFDRKAESLLSKLEEYKKEFVSSFYKGIEDGHLPITKQEFDSRIEAISFSVFDGLDKDYLGEHGKGSSISFNVDINPGHIRHAVFHEMVHGVAGKSILSYKQGQREIVFEQKNGLLLRLEQSGKSEVKAAFSWMNEALTENIAIYLLEKSGKKEEETDYDMERSMVKSIISSGVSEDLFIKAFFEDYNISAKPGERMPLWRELAGKLNEVGKDVQVDIRVFSRMFS